MAVLLIILMVTMGLAFRAGTYSRMWSPSESESAPESGFADACARTFILVLISLAGLLALGIMYGNVLGAANAGR
jgi:ABC-type phosphate transport system permease subunit